MPPLISSFARLCPALFLCTGLAIAPLPAAAFGGFGIGGGLGGLMHHGFGGGFGSGRGIGSPRFMPHGGPGFAGRGFQGSSPWGQYRGQSQLRQRAPLGADGGGNESTVVGLATGDRLRLTRGNSQRALTAAAAHVVQITPLGGAKDIRLRLAPRKSRRGGGRHEEPVMATHVPHRQKWAKGNPLGVAA
jgi:hypothetical protein